MATSLCAGVSLLRRSPKSRLWLYALAGWGVLFIVVSAIRGHAVDGAPVINGIPIVVKMAEMAVKLRRLAGLGVSRVSDYVQPPIEILEEFLTHPKGL